MHRHVEGPWKVPRHANGRHMGSVGGQARQADDMQVGISQAVPKLQLAHDPGS